MSMVLEIRVASTVEVIGGLVEDEGAGYANERMGSIIKLHLTDHQVRRIVDQLCEAYGEDAIVAMVRSET